MTVVGTVAVAAQLAQRRVVAQSKAEKATVVPVSTSCVSACGPSVLGKGLTGVDLPVLAVRGSAGVCTRGAKIVTKSYTKRGPYRKFRNYHIWQKWTKHMPGLPSQQFRKSREACMHMLKKQYKTRRLFKRERRTLWIMRVAANCRLHGVRYSQFIAKLYRSDIIINRKILSQLGVYDRPVFTNVMDLAIPEWKEQLDRKMNPPSRKYTAEETDDIMITHLEKRYPELYTDPCIRFNRKVTENGPEYTVDVGDPEEWRKLLPKSPELANFNLPDHFVEDANYQTQVNRFLDVLKIRNEDPLDEEYLAAQKEYQKKLEKEEAMAERGEPLPPKKEGVSRDDWFKDEPQSWY